MKPRTLLVLLAGVLAGCRAQDPAPLGRLAFIRNDTLYVQALPDGRARLLVAGRGLAQPRWSASGQWLALHASDGLRLLRSDGGGGQQLTKVAADFAWAPTDDRIAYIAEGNLVVLRAGGIGVVLAEKTRAAAAEGLAWSPDGQRLAFATRPPADSGVAPAGGGEPAAAPRAAPPRPPALWSIPARGGPTLALPLPTAGAGMPLVRGWTGDGRVLALLRPGDVRAGTAVTGAAPLIAAPGSGAAGQPAGTLAAAVLDYPDFVAPRPGQGQVAVVEGAGPETWSDKVLVIADGAGRVRVSAPGRAAGSPAWSRDGRRLAWVERPESDPAGGDAAPGARWRGRGIMVADVAGNGAIRSARPLGEATDRREFPRWTTDGRHLLLVRVDSAGRAGVWLGAEGESVRPIVAALSPPAGDPGWTGTRGHVAWDDILDYWPGPPSRPH